MSEEQKLELARKLCQNYYLWKELPPEFKAKIPAFLLYHVFIKPKCEIGIRSSLCGDLPDLASLASNVECLHNEDVYPAILQNHYWSNNYTSKSSRKLMDTHCITFSKSHNGIEYEMTLLFFSFKKDVELTLQLIKNEINIGAILYRSLVIMESFNMLS